MSNNAHELSNRLLNALDNNYNVVDMHTVNDIISILEKFNITKELLETTRLGKHVNELRRKTSDPTLARRAKVLVKRWRDLVIPSVASPGHTGSNRSSAERQMRRLGGTPLTSPALSRQVVSPAVPSPRPPSRPAWGGYESDSQDVILVDDEPPASAPPAAALLAHALANSVPPVVKRPPTPEVLHDEKKAKRDKKPKKRRSHSRAGTGTEATAGIPATGPPAGALPTGAVPAGALPGAGAAWRERNGTHPERRRNGCRKDAVDPYAALVNRLPPVGAKKVKTTKELLEQIQSRGAAAPSAPPSPAPASPASPDVMLIEPDPVSVKVESPLRNGGPSPAPPPTYEPLPPLEDEREPLVCTCGEDGEDADCPGALQRVVDPLHVAALHHVHLPGVNGTRAPPHPHPFAVRHLLDPDRPGLFTSVVPLYKYSDYADDYCVKNMSNVPLCTHLPWTQFAPSPPHLPPPPSPPPLVPYPETEAPEEGPEEGGEKEIKMEVDCPKIEAELVGVPSLEPSERLKAPLLTNEDETQFGKNEKGAKMELEDQFESSSPDHRTVERTKEDMDGQKLFDLCRRAIDAIPYDYAQMGAAPVLSCPAEPAAVLEALADAPEPERDPMGRPARPVGFTEWHECARLGELIALPYVVID